MGFVRIIRLLLIYFASWGHSAQCVGWCGWLNYFKKWSRGYYCQSLIWVNAFIWKISESLGFLWVSRLQEILKVFFYKIFMSKYVLDILSKVKLLEANPASILVKQRQLALADGWLPHDPERYWRIMGYLIYLYFTHLELSYYVHVLSQFIQ